MGERVRSLRRLATVDGSVLGTAVSYGVLDAAVTDLVDCSSELLAGAA
jgi:hypothetical protein